jgi:hypothetical protein
LRIVVMPPFDREFFGGRDRLELDAPTLFALVGKLDALAGRSRRGDPAAAGQRRLIAARSPAG